MSQGLVERLNRTLATALSLYIADDQRDWDTYLPGVTWGYNTACSQQSTAFTPYNMLYGRQPLQLHDTALTLASSVPKPIREHLAMMIRNLEIAHEIASHNLEIARKKMKARYDLKSVPPSFQIGDMVWLYVPRVRVGLSKSLGQFWTGPYYIIEQVSETNFKIRTWDNRKVPQVVHSNRLKRFYQEDRNELQVPPPQMDGVEQIEPFPSEYIRPDHLQEAEIGPLPEGNGQENEGSSTTDTDSVSGEEDDNIYTVENILKTRMHERNREYLVKWKGYPHSDNTWEPEGHILDKSPITDFEGRCGRRTPREP
jgi:hypothetical protein